MSTPKNQLAFLQQDSLVNRTPVPGSKEAMKMTERSGRKLLECYANLKHSDCSRIGAFLKMLLESSTWRSTVCYLTWKTKVTPHKRLLYQLAPSTPRTNETGFGYLLPTPNAAQAPNKNANTNGPKSLTEVSKTDWMPGMLWRTPTVGCVNQARSIDPEYGIKLLSKGQTLTLAAQVTNSKLWPTPTARDWKDGSAKACQNVPTNGLLGRVDHAAPAMLPTPTASRRTGLQSHGVNVIEGSLSPEWVTWLMGYPETWVSIEQMPKQEEDQWIQIS